MSEEQLAKVKAATRPETSVPIPMAGHLIAEHEELDRQLVELLRTAPKSLAGPPPEAREVAERITAIEAELAASVVAFRVRAMGKTKWRKLVAEHTPRPDNDSDLRAGYNVESFAEVAVRKCVIEPAMDQATWDTFIDDLSDGGYEQLTDAMWKVNRSSVSVPFSRAASATLALSSPE